MAGGKVNWKGNQVKLEVADATAESLAAIALQIEAITKININEADLIDTGFFINSVYTITKQGSSYSDTDPSGTYLSQNAGMVKREMAPEASLTDDAGAAVVLGASYSIYLEQKNSLLYRAAEQVAGQVDGLIKQV